MKSKGSALILAGLLAAAATAAVFLYVKGVRQQVKTSSTIVRVIVAKQDIGANTQLAPLVSSGAFETRGVPQDALVRGVVTSLSQLQGQTTAVPILANAQISTVFFSGSGQNNRLNIPKGYVAATISLNQQQMVGGFISRGDHVTVYGTVNHTTQTLIPDARVLVGSPTTGQPAGSDTSGLITLALTPGDAERLVAAQSGQVWLVLLPPGQQGTSQPPISMGG